MDQSGNNHLLVRASQPGQLTHSSYQAATDRMRDLLARTVQDHIGRERETATALAEIRRRLDALEQVSLAGIAATQDGLAANLGALDSKLAARLERLDERLDDQYDKVRSIEAAVSGAGGDGRVDEQVAKAVEAAVGEVLIRIAALEDTLLTLAEALLRPAIRVPVHALPNGAS